MGIYKNNQKFSGVFEKAKNIIFDKLKKGLLKSDNVQDAIDENSQAISELNSRLTSITLNDIKVTRVGVQITSGAEKHFNYYYATKDLQDMINIYGGVLSMYVNSSDGNAPVILNLIQNHILRGYFPNTNCNAWVTIIFAI